MFRVLITGVLLLSAGFILLADTVRVHAKDALPAPPGNIAAGISLYDSGRYQDALELFVNLEKRMPDDSRLMYETALACYHLGYYKQALAYARKSEKLNPGPVEPVILTGNIHEQMGSDDKALKAYLSSVEKAPDNPVVFFNLGVFYYNTGQNSEADAAFSRAISIDPRFASAYYAAGFVNIRLNNPETAENRFRSFLTLEPGGIRYEEVSRILATYFKTGP